MVNANFSDTRVLYNSSKKIDTPRHQIELNNFFRLWVVWEEKLNRDKTLKYEFHRNFGSSNFITART